MRQRVFRTFYTPDISFRTIIQKYTLFLNHCLFSFPSSLPSSLASTSISMATSSPPPPRGRSYATSSAWAGGGSCHENPAQTHPRPTRLPTTQQGPSSTTPPTSSSTRIGRPEMSISTRAGSAPLKPCGSWLVSASSSCCRLSRQVLPKSENVSLHRSN